ncbi:MAG: phosphoribosylformylglycinamidine synthase [Clostridiales bacterium]|nr:phosphoribosylformylglycinamidine synthase [Clostridiales bacterium]
MVYRIYSERKPEFSHEAEALLFDLKTLHGIGGIKRIRILRRYDAENIPEETFLSSVSGIFSDPRTEESFTALPDGADAAFAVEYLPGQFDQCADAAQMSIRLVGLGGEGGADPIVRTAKVYLLYGDLTDEELKKVKASLINPVDSREGGLEEYESLVQTYDEPEEVEFVHGFTNLSEEGLKDMIKRMGLAMDLADLTLCRDYFKKEGRDPSVTEIKVLDTYWSDHCRHTTFNTRLENVEFSDPEVRAAWERYLKLREETGDSKPVCLMDLATVGAKYLKRTGDLSKLDESKEINACTVRIDADVNGEKEPWLLLFKNETHNHPTEIEPFGGAATCVGGAIRDPLSGRGYVYQSMRVTGAADPTRPVEETIKGKLPQRRIVREAASGFSSYGNQIGLATGMVSELYHEGYAAKRMEVGAVIAAVPAANVRREEPLPGDAVILMGGKTGRDGCGGATGASKAHTVSSLDLCGAEVQKGNAPEERKLQRLFRNPEASLMIKRCNDFGAGGVSVAIGELADGLDIDLDKVPKKYMGLDSTELAISESQERMAVVVEKKDAERFIALCAAEGIRAVEVAHVTGDGRLTMYFKGKKAVDLPRGFIDSNGAPKKTEAYVGRQFLYTGGEPEGSLLEKLRSVVSDLNVCSKRGLAEMFDSTVGANTVLMPFGGKYQLTPTQAMAAKIPMKQGDTDTCSFMSWGFDPLVSESSPYYGSYIAVVDSYMKLAAAGADMDECWFSFQEYFERMKDESSWGKPLSALLGALDAQTDLKTAAIGGKDSMSGSFEDIHVPPTLISFAAATGRLENVISPEFKAAGHLVYRVTAPKKANGLPNGRFVKELSKLVSDAIKKGVVVSAYVPGRFGTAEAAVKMAMGNGVGVKLFTDRIYRPEFGTFVLECTEEPDFGFFETEKIGETLSNPVITVSLSDPGYPAREPREESVRLSSVLEDYEARLDGVFPVSADGGEMLNVECADKPYAKPFGVKTAHPAAVIPVFPGTNCEYETERAFLEAGFDTRIVIVRTGSDADLGASVAEFAGAIDRSELMFIPGGFSNGDEPDGSGKFIAAFLNNPEVRRSVEAMLARGGLAGGICNGFQALLRTGLLPYGEFRAISSEMPTLTHNLIGRHISRIVRVRVETNASPWLRNVRRGEVYCVPVSHGEGRFAADPEVIRALAANGRIITRYVDAKGEPSMDMSVNPNGSVAAIEGIMSPDGRVFGKMGHSERIGRGLYKNVGGVYDMGLFRSAYDFFN